MIKIGKQRSIKITQFFEANWKDVKEYFKKEIPLVLKEIINL
jgi:hypothetical protein